MPTTTTHITRHRPHPTKVAMLLLVLIMMICNPATAPGITPTGMTRNPVPAAGMTCTPGPVAGMICSLCPVAGITPAGDQTVSGADHKPIQTALSLLGRDLSQRNTTSSPLGTGFLPGQNAPSDDATPPPRRIDVEDLILKHSINCSDIAVAATKLIPMLHGEVKTDTSGADTPKADTLRAILSYWQEHCGVTEPLMRYTVLTEIRAGTFHESRLPALVLDYLDDYMDAAITDTETFSDYFFDFRRGEYVAMHPGFNDFSALLADQLREIPNLHPIELFFADFYANDFEDALLRLESGQLEGSMMDSLYRPDNPLRETQVAMRARRMLPLPGDDFPDGPEVPGVELDRDTVHREGTDAPTGRPEDQTTQAAEKTAFRESDPPKARADTTDQNGRRRGAPDMYTPETDTRDRRDHRESHDPDDPRHAEDPGMRQIRPQDRPGVHWGGTLGWWSPMGKLRTMGHHPQAGFIAGGTTRNFLAGFQMKIGFLNTPVHYEAVVDGELYETRNFTQIFLGIHGGINVFGDPVHSFYITGGVGYDGIDPLKYSHRQEDSTDVSHMINSLNLNTGLTYKRIINEQRFFSVMLRYNFLNYRNRGGSDLSGDVITVGFAYGIHERW